MEYREIKVLKQSEKSTVMMVGELNGERVFVKKTLKGQHHIYSELQSCPHACLPKLYDVTFTQEHTIIIEEYIEGQSLGSAELSETQVVHAIKELCSVLEFLHEKDIIHRDIKPSNIILAKDGHIRLIDFDAARMPKEDLEQDTKLLGTRGYAPPEQYGFAQTDARADIYALGVTIGQLLGDTAHKPRYRRIIGKCTNLNPDMRYQTARQVRKAFSSRERTAIYAALGMTLLVVLWTALPQLLTMQQPEDTLPVSQPAAAVSATSSQTGPTPTVLPAPENPRWNGETGIALWGNVPDSGVGGELSYKWKLYRRDTATPPDLEATHYWEGRMRGNGRNDNTFPTYDVNLGSHLKDNGFYYFAVAAVGDGVNFTDSPYVLSDVFEFTGEDAPPLPTPTGLYWKLLDGGKDHFANWSNLDDYADADSFEVRVYNQSGAWIATNIWTKSDIISTKYGGVWLSPDIFEEAGPYRFTVQAQTSRPNDFKSSPMPDPPSEEYFSPWDDAN